MKLSITAFKKLTTAKIISELPTDVTSAGKTIFTASATAPTAGNQVTEDQLISLVLKARGEDGSDSAHTASAKAVVDSFLAGTGPDPTPPPSPKPDPVPTTQSTVDKPNWLGDWLKDVKSFVQGVTNDTKNTSLFVLYNIPNRDNNGYSGGGLHSSSDYAAWVTDVAAGIGDAPAICVLEPDALGLSRSLSDADKTARYAMLQNAIKILKANANTKVYIDSSIWTGQADSVTLLNKFSGMDGFSCNVSGYLDMNTCTTYAAAVSGQTGLHYIVDTSRNGKGAPHGSEIWCNQTDTQVGIQNTIQPTKMCDAYLWIKIPGESDGPQINGNGQGATRADVPAAGILWPDFKDAIYSGDWSAFKLKYHI